MSVSTVLTETKISKVYYPSFDAFEAEVHKRIIENAISPETYRTPVAALYMLWHGIHRENLSEIRKYDIMDDHIYDPVGQKAYSMCSSALEFIRAYADSSLTTPDYIRSQYVLRTRVSGHMSEATIVRAVSRLNIQMNTPADEGFQMIAVYESGLFSRIWKMQQQGYEFPVYRKNRRLSDEGLKEFEALFCRKFANINYLTAYYRKYQAYIKYFHNKE